MPIVPERSRPFRPQTFSRVLPRATPGVALGWGMAGPLALIGYQDGKNLRHQVCPRWLRFEPKAAECRDGPPAKEEREWHAVVQSRQRKDGWPESLSNRDRSKFFPRRFFSGHQCAFEAVWSYSCHKFWVIFNHGCFSSGDRPSAVAATVGDRGERRSARSGGWRGGSSPAGRRSPARS